ncbi:MAG: peptide deformylase [bacterium]|nr:peptide deformylase [bacterium]
MIRPIVKVPQKVLTTQTKPVKRFDAKLHKLIADMKDTLQAARDPEGVGLAATQVGVGLSVFIMKPSKSSSYTVCINPIILTSEGIAHIKKKKSPRLEGCLSIENIWSPVSRTNKVKLQYQDELGVTKIKVFSTFPAVIVQHEVDHLNGVLFTQRALEQGRTLYREIEGELKKVDY